MLIYPYLVVNSRGGCRITKTQPALQWDEISIRLELALPDELFTKPSLTASISVKDEAINSPAIEAVVIDNIEKSIKEHTGIEVKLSVENNSEEE